MQILNNEQKIIINYILNMYNTTKSKIQKDIYENDLISYIKKQEITECDEVLNALNKNIEKVYLYIMEYNYQYKVKNFEELINDIFLNEKYQEYAFENPSLRNDLEEELLKIKDIHKYYKISDELISKLINTMKARVNENNSSILYDLPWAPEVLLSIELLSIFMKERLELYYLNPLNTEHKFISTVKSVIIEQRLNKNWIEEEKEFILKNKIEYFTVSERSILSDLLDFLPELKSIKLGICMNFPEKYIPARLNLILEYFEKSEVDSNRKVNALKLINLFFNEYLFKNNKSSMSMECKDLINKIKENIIKTKKEEKLLLKQRTKIEVKQEIISNPKINLNQKKDTITQDKKKRNKK